MTWATLLRRVLTGRRGRTLFSMFSVALGVTVFVAVSIGARNLSSAVTAADQALDESVVQLAPIGVFDTTAPADVAAPLADLPGVTEVKTALQVPANLEPLQDAGETMPVSLVAVDTAGEKPGDGVLTVPATLADQLGLQPGERVRLHTRTGVHEGVIGDLVPAGQPQSPFVIQGNRTTVEDWSGQPGRISSAFVVLRPGIDRDAWIDRHGTDLGAFAPLSSGTMSSSRAEDFFQDIEDSIAPVGGAALFVAGYLIFLTLSRAVREQAHDHATMRVVGASSTQIGVLVVIEAAAIATVGTIIGLLVGISGGGLVAEVMRQIFGLNVAAADITIPADIILTGAALGMLIPMAAAVLPAYRAARTDPVDSLHGVDKADSPAGRPVRAAAGAVLIGGGLTALAVVPDSWTSVATLATLAGAAVLLPVLAQPIGQATSQLLARLSPGPGEIAAQDLARRPGHSASTAALLAVTLALAVLVGTINASTRPGFIRVLDSHYGTDLTAQTNETDGLTVAQVDQVRALPGVADATPQASGRVRVHTNNAGVHPLLVIDPDSYFRIADLAWTDSTDATQAIEQLAGGDHVALAHLIADDADVGVGDPVTLATPAGPATFTVAGIFYGLGYGETASVVTTMTDAHEHFGLRGATSLLINRAPTSGSLQADVAAVGLPELFVIPNHVIHDQLAAQFDGLSGLITVILIITASVGVLGLANTLLIDTLDRRREIGIMRAIGAARGDVTRFILARSLVLTTTAGIGATALGLLLGIAAVVPRDTNLDIEATYRFPTTTTIAVLALALVIGVGASLQPARRASHLEPGVALRQA